MSGRKGNRTQRAVEELTQSMFDSIAKSNAAAAELPEDATGFDIQAKVEGWSEEEIRKRKSLMKIEELLEESSNALLRSKAIYYASLALGLEAPNVPLEGEGPTKAQAVQLVAFTLGLWHKKKSFFEEKGENAKRGRDRFIRSTIQGLAEVRPTFSKLRPVDVLVVFRNVDARTAPYTALRKLADLAEVWPSETAANLKKAWHRYR